MNTGTTKARLSLSPRAHLWHSEADHRPACLVADGLKPGGLRYVALRMADFVDLPEQATCARCRRLVAREER